MTALARSSSSSSALTRRERADRTVTGALRGGTLAAAAAGIAWLVAGAISASAFGVLVVATVALIGYTVWTGKTRATLWAALVAAWAIVLLQQWVVQAHGGVWVAIAAWLGVVIGARRAGISKWSLPLLAYPAISVAIVLVNDEGLLSPWGSSWLWLPAVLVPVLGARTLLSAGGPQRQVPPPARSVS